MISFISSRLRTISLACISMSTALALGAAVGSDRSRLAEGRRILGRRQVVEVLIAANSLIHSWVVGADAVRAFTGDQE